MLENMGQKIAAQKRQEAIKALLQQMIIMDQSTLVSLLLERYGIETNQAVVSRDLRKLGVVKKEKDSQMVYELPVTDVRCEILKLAIIDIEHNEVMIVISTQPGLADFVGDCVDQHTDLDILGSLAGENVVFVAPRSLSRIHETYQALSQRLYFKK